MILEKYSKRCRHHKNNERNTDESICCRCAFNPEKDVPPTMFEEKDEIYGKTVPDDKYCSRKVVKMKTAADYEKNGLARFYDEELLKPFPPEVRAQIAEETARGYCHGKPIKNLEITENEHGGKQHHRPFRSEALFFNALLAVSNVRYEAVEVNGYPDDNYKQIPINVHLGRALTHIFSYFTGGKATGLSKDEDLSHAACRILMALEILIEQEKNDKCHGCTNTSAAVCLNCRRSRPEGDMYSFILQDMYDGKDKGEFRIFPMSGNAPINRFGTPAELVKEKDNGKED